MDVTKRDRSFRVAFTFTNFRVLVPSSRENWSASGRLPVFEVRSEGIAQEPTALAQTTCPYTIDASAQFRLLADGVLLVHFLFLGFVLLGGLWVLWRPFVAWFHLPCVFWGIVIELKGFICPLTPLENYLRK